MLTSAGNREIGDVSKRDTQLSGVSQSDTSPKIKDPKYLTKMLDKCTKNGTLVIDE